MDKVTLSLNNFALLPLSVFINVSSIIFYLLNKQLRSTPLKVYLVSISVVNLVYSLQSIFNYNFNLHEISSLTCKTAYFTLDACTTLLTWLTLALAVSQYFGRKGEKKQEVAQHWTLVVAIMLLSCATNVITPLRVDLAENRQCVFNMENYLYFIIEAFLTIIINFLIPLALLVVIIVRFWSKKHQAQHKCQFTKILLIYSNFFYVAYSVTIAFTLLNLYYTLKFYPGVILVSEFEINFDSQLNTVASTLFSVYLVLFNPIMVLIIVKKYTGFKLCSSVRTIETRAKEIIENNVVLDVQKMNKRKVDNRKK